MSDQSLHAIWEASAKQPFYPNVGKDAQITIGSFLLLGGFSLTALFGLNLSLKNLPILALPASFAFGFGAVYMICAVGVYEYRLYKPKRLPDPPVHIPVRRNFHPVTSTLFILAWGLTGFFAVSALALYLAKGLPRWKQTAGFPKSEL